MCMLTMEVQGPLAGGAGLLPPRGLQDQIEVVRFDGKYLNWMSHLAGPS